MSFIPRLSYTQKGCMHRMIYSSTINDNNGNYVGDTIIDKENLYNRFHFLSTDFLIKIGKMEYSRIQFSFYTGIRTEILMFSQANYNIDFTDFRKDYAMTETSMFKDFNRFSYGLINGVSLEFNKKAYLQLEMNNDLSLLVNNETMKVRNLTFSLNMGIYLNKLPKYKIVKQKQD